MGIFGGPEPRTGKSFACWPECTFALDGFDFSPGTGVLEDAIGTNNGTSGSGLTYNDAGYFTVDGNQTSRFSYTSFTPGNGSWTMSTWARGTLPSGTFGRLISNSSGGPVASAFGLNTSGMSYHSYYTSWSATYGNTNLSNDTWYHCVWANGTGGSGTMIMYLNGVADSSEFNSQTSNGGPINVWGSNWSGTFVGDMACMNFYSGTTLSADEILKMYNAQKSRFN